MAHLAQLVPPSPPPPLPTLLSASQMERAGRFFVDALATVKHNGATEKLHLGFGFLCRALLQQQDAALSALPGEWLQALLRAVTQRDQTRSDIVRRSAGLPLAFVAVFQAEAAGAPRRLLPAAAKALLAIAGGGDAAHDPVAPEHDACANGASGAAAAGGAEVDVSNDVWARVHAFNCLRVTFDSSALAADTSSHLSAGAQLCVLAMSSPHWEVRSSPLNVCTHALHGVPLRLLRVCAPLNAQPVRARRFETRRRCVMSQSRHASWASRTRPSSTARAPPSRSPASWLAIPTCTPFSWRSSRRR